VKVARPVRKGPWDTRKRVLVAYFTQRGALEAVAADTVRVTTKRAIAG